MRKIPIWIMCFVVLAVVGILCKICTIAGVSEELIVLIIIVGFHTSLFFLYLEMKENPVRY